MYGLKTQKLRQYAQTLEKHISKTVVEAKRRSLDRYINLVRKKAEDCDPINKIIEEIIISIGFRKTSEKDFY